MLYHKEYCQIVYPMNNQERRRSFNSSFSHRRHNELANYLIGEMGLDPLVAHTLLHLHKPATLSDALDLLVFNEDLLINHYFIPHQDPTRDECRVCASSRDEHMEGDEQRVSGQWSQQVQTSSALHFEKEQEQVPKQTCEICYIEVIEEDMVKIKGVVHNICLQCMEIYLKEEISNMRVEGLSCPHCNMVLPNEFIQEILDRPTYNKYRQFVRNLQIHKNPNLKWCPNSKCSIVVSTHPKKKTSKCPKCATLICNRCNREAHPKSSCEGAFKKEIKNWENAKDVQKCKKCSGLVEKIAGCNHMTCSICHFEWCWLCGSEYSATHFSPLNPFGCPGLMDGPRDDWTKCKIVLLRIGILFLLVIGLPVMLPVVMVAVGPVLVFRVLHDCWYPEGCCKKTGVVLLASIIGLIVNPFCWIGCLVFLIPKGIVRLCDWYRQRRQEQQRRTNFLQQRLLGEQIIEQPGIE